MRTSPLLLCGLFLAACGTNASDAGTGTASIVLTDSATDELTQFEVDVSGIQFTKLGGATVSVLPRTTRVDFLQLESLNELIVSGSLEAGLYSRITMTLDFSNANVVIAGQTTPATVKDQAGATLSGPVTVNVDLPSGSRPAVVAGRGHMFVLDLDLDQSITVDSAGNSVTFSPSWSVERDPSNPKPLVMSGTLQSVNTTALSFVVDRRGTDNLVVDTFTVQTDTSTVFQLDGVVSTGATGLGSLAANLGDYLFVQGTFDAETRTITAAAVESGGGVPGNGQDWVLGHVVGRIGGAGVDATLQVRGRSFDIATSTRTFNTLHTVNVSFADTRVLRRGAGNSLNTDAINVGQLVWIFGDLTGTAMTATTTDSVARLLRTSIFGIATGAPASNTLTLDLTRFDLRPIGDFDFNVSGQVQADPDAFTIDVTGLATDGIDNGSRLRVFGWVSPVGASGTDATGLSIIDRTDSAKVLLCHWNPASASAIVVSGSTTGLQLDLTGADIKVVGDGFAPTTLTTTPAPTIQGLASTGIFRIQQDGGVTMFTNFATFRSQVLERAASNPTRRISAFGTFEPTTQVFSALTVTVAFD